MSDNKPNRLDEDNFDYQVTKDNNDEQQQLLNNTKELSEEQLSEMINRKFDLFINETN